jgi:hypothetical protein
VQNYTSPSRRQQRLCRATSSTCPSIKPANCKMDSEGEQVSEHKEEPLVQSVYGRSLAPPAIPPLPFQSPTSRSHFQEPSPPPGALKGIPSTLKTCPTPLVHPCKCPTWTGLPRGALPAPISVTDCSPLPRLLEGSDNYDKSLLFDLICDHFTSMSVRDDATVPHPELSTNGPY